MQEHTVAHYFFTSWRWIIITNFDKIYYTIDKSVYVMNLTATAAPTTPLLTYNSDSEYGAMYGFAVNNGKIYIAEVNSKFHILQPSKEGCKRLHAQLFKGKPGEDGNAGEDVEINGSPAIINGKIIFMTSEDLYCIGKPDWKPSAPEVKPESKAVTLGEAAHLQIVPADFVLNPEAKQSLAAFAYDANGKFL